MNQQLKNLLERTLVATQPLAEAATVADTKFLTVLLGIYRISFTTIRDIDHLISNGDAGASILDLTRKLIEHGISVEYMLWKGKEEMAERFQNYLTVQIHEEIELLKTIGQDPATVSTELKLGIEDAEKEYAALSGDAKKDKSWAGRNFEGMLQDLKTAGVITEADSPRLLSAYIWGCRLNHPNPFVVHGYLDKDQYDVASDFYSRLGILMALAVHLRLTTRFIDESRSAVNSDIYPEIAGAISAIQTNLNNLT